jgi:predicted alpha/beta superfamily hydrolase
MKFITIFILACAVLACSTKKSSQVAKPEFRVVDSIFSKVLNEQRKIWIYVPEGVASASLAGTKYPVVYLLDGDSHFYSFAGMIQQLSHSNGNTVCPEMIVVAISNTDRTRDLTPSHARSMFGDSSSAKTSGGAENFTRFLSTELMPYIDNKYPTSSHRVLVGHSFGGLFAINTLVNHPSLFTNYLAIDPSLWWDDAKLASQADHVLDSATLSGKSLYVAIANTMSKGMDVEKVVADTTELTRHIREIIKFDNAMKSKAKNGLTYNSKYYADDDHGSVPLIAEYDALHKWYAWYRLEGLVGYLDPHSTATAADVVRDINGHYKLVSERLGYEVLPPREIYLDIGWAFLSQKMMDKALACFEENVRNYPNHPGVYHAMGDYYTEKKDSARAAENFKKSLGLREDEDVREKLRKVQK